MLSEWLFLSSPQTLPYLLLYNTYFSLCAQKRVCYDLKFSVMFSFSRLFAFNCIANLFCLPLAKKIESNDKTDLWGRLRVHLVYRGAKWWSRKTGRRWGGWGEGGCGLGTADARGWTQHKWKEGWTLRLACYYGQGDWCGEMGGNNTFLEPLLNTWLSQDCGLEGVLVLPSLLLSGYRPGNWLFGSSSS